MKYTRGKKLFTITEMGEKVVDLNVLSPKKAGLSGMIELEIMGVRKQR